jgi:hypothetical protein
VPQPLTEVERRVVAALMQPDAKIADKTTAAIAGRARLPEPEVDRVLRGLEGRDPAIVLHERDEPTGIEFWISFEAAGDALDAGA